MLLGQLPSQIAAGSAGMYSGAGYGPALMQAFLNRFGPYRLQPFDVMRPVIPVTGGGMGLFEPRGLEASGLFNPPQAPFVPFRPDRGGGNGRGGNGNEPNTGRGRGGPGARGADRSGGAVGGKATGPGGPKGGRSGPVSR